jgi:hypothetical protein
MTGLCFFGEESSSVFIVLNSVVGVYDSPRYADFHQATPMRCPVWSVAKKTYGSGFEVKKKLVN